jgi:hypothetical protein
MLLWQSSYGIIWRRRLKESIDSLSRKLAYRRRGRIVWDGTYLAHKYHRHHISVLVFRTGSCYPPYS